MPSELLPGWRLRVPTCRSWPKRRALVGVGDPGIAWLICLQPALSRLQLAQCEMKERAQWFLLMENTVGFCNQLGLLEESGK